MKVYIAVEKFSGYTVMRMINSFKDEIRYESTDCRYFDTFEEAQDAAKYMAKRDGIEYVNMR